MARVVTTYLAECTNQPVGQGGLEGYQRGDIVYIQNMQDNSHTLTQGNKYARVYYQGKRPSAESKNHGDYCTCSMTRAARHFTKVKIKEVANA